MDEAKARGLMIDGVILFSTACCVLQASKAELDVLRSHQEVAHTIRDDMKDKQVCADHSIDLQAC